MKGGGERGEGRGEDWGEKGLGGEEKGFRRRWDCIREGGRDLLLAYPELAERVSVQEIDGRGQEEGR